MRRIAIIGAGSIVFCKTLITDIMATKDLEDTEFVLMAPSTSKTSQVKAYADKVIEKNGLMSKVSITTDRREALKGADYVICSFQIGGWAGSSSLKAKARICTQSSVRNSSSRSIM